MIFGVSNKSIRGPTLRLVCMASLLVRFIFLKLFYKDDLNNQHSFHSHVQVMFVGVYQIELILQ